MGKKKKNKKMMAFLSISLLVLIVAIIVLASQGFSVSGGSDTVWIPDYGTVKCEQTRLECDPGVCSDTNPEYRQIPQDGASIYCEGGTGNSRNFFISDANYYEGCNIYLRSDGWFGGATIKICEADGTNCQTVTPEPDTRKFTGDTRRVELRAGQKLYVNPLIKTYEYHLVAPVYGISIEGAVKPSYSDRCNVASLLNQHQVAVLKNSADYTKVIAAGEINPGVFPVVFVTGYKASYKDQRVLEKNGDPYFVEDIGYICKIKKDTNERWIVTDDCTSDNSIECYPNIANCDKNGKLITTQDGTSKACEPGTLIGSSTRRIAISSDEACKMRCSDNGVPEKFDCVDIPKCTDGKVLNQNYECVDSTKITEKEKCEAEGGTYKETKDKDGNIVSECDYSPTDYFYAYLIIIVLVAIIIMLLIYYALNR